MVPMPLVVRSNTAPIHYRQFIHLALLTTVRSSRFRISGGTPPRTVTFPTLIEHHLKLIPARPDWNESGSDDRLESHFFHFDSIRPGGNPSLVASRRIVTVS